MIKIPFMLILVLFFSVLFFSIKPGEKASVFLSERSDPWQKVKNRDKSIIIYSNDWKKAIKMR